MRFWPATDRAQLDYARLRKMALAETDLIGPAANRSNMAAKVIPPGGGRNGADRTKVLMCFADW